MRWRRFIGPAAISVVIAVVAFVLWWWQQGHSSRRHAENQRPAAASNNSKQAEKTARKSAAEMASAKSQQSFHFLSQPTPEAPDPVSTKPDDRFKYRLTNTSKPIGDLVHNQKAILLEN